MSKFLDEFWTASKIKTFNPIDVMPPPPPPLPYFSGGSDGNNGPVSTSAAEATGEVALPGVEFPPLIVDDDAPGSLGTMFLGDDILLYDDEEELDDDDDDLFGRCRTPDGDWREDGELVGILKVVAKTKLLGVSRKNDSSRNNRRPVRG